MIHAYQKEQDDDNDWNDIPMAAQQPYPSSPPHHLAKIPSFGVKHFNFVALTNKEQKRLITKTQGFTNKLVEQTQNILQCVKDQPVP
jgi:hypothetical protein